MGGNMNGSRKKVPDIVIMERDYFQCVVKGE